MYASYPDFFNVFSTHSMDVIVFFLVSSSGWVTFMSDVFSVSLSTQIAPYIRFPYKYWRSTCSWWPICPNLLIIYLHTTPSGDSQVVPHFIWYTLIAGIILGLSRGRQNSLSAILSNFIALLGFWELLLVGCMASENFILMPRDGKIKRLYCLELLSWLPCGLAMRSLSWACEAPLQNHTFVSGSCALLTCYLSIHAR